MADNQERSQYQRAKIDHLIYQRTFQQFRGGAPGVKQQGLPWYTSKYADTTIT